MVEETDLLLEAKKVLESGYLFSCTELRYPHLLPKVVSRNLDGWQEFKALEIFMDSASYELNYKRVVETNFGVCIYAEFISKSLRFDLEMERLLGE